MSETLRVRGEHRRYQRQQGEGRASGKCFQLVRNAIAQAPSAAVLRWGGYFPSSAFTRTPRTTAIPGSLETSRFHAFSRR